MDQTGSLIDTKLKITPSKKFIDFLKTYITVDEDTPLNIVKIVKGAKASLLCSSGKENVKNNLKTVSLTDKEIDDINKICNDVLLKESDSENAENAKNFDNSAHTEAPNTKPTNVNVCLETTDLEWLYFYLNEERSKGKQNIPYLHTLLEGSNVGLPENEVIKRNPVLEARCVKLRAQQEGREYRKMTKTVDNVRMRYPEDSIAYQLKSMNRQLIAVGQFVISIFAGFLFGFRGIEWMVGTLDFGFRLLLGVMCALIIALTEIYFLAKKLNEELNLTEPVQLGGPPKFNADDKLHKD